jgi:two-component system, sensor histidine kinase PdtaS
LQGNNGLLSYYPLRTSAHKDFPLKPEHMFKAWLIITLFCLGMLNGSAQNESSSYSYRHPSLEKESWQRLLLFLSALSYYSVKQGDIHWDSSLVYVSQSLGLSRLPVTADGIDDPELLAESQWFDQRNTREGIHLLSQAKGKKHLQLLILLGAYYAFDPNRAVKRDSAIHFLNQAVDESKIANNKKLRRVALCLLGKALVQGGDTAKGNATFRQLVQECQKDGDKKTAARAWGYWGLFATTSPTNRNAKLVYLEKATELYSELQDAEGQIVMLTRRGYFYLGQGRLDEAYNTFLKAGELQRTIRFPYLHYNTDDLTMLTMVQGKFGEPLRYALETVKISEATRDSVNWATFYTRLGGLYITEGGREEEGIKWMVKSIDRFAAENNPDLYLTLFTVASSLAETGKAQEAFDLITRISKKVQPNLRNQVFYNMSFAVACMGLKQHRLAEQYVMKADSLRKEFSSIPQLAVYNEYLGKVIATLLSQVYFEAGQYAKAKNVLQPHMDAAPDLTLLENDIVIYKQLLRIDSVFNDNASAVKHYRLYTQLLDSNFKVSKVRQAEELQVMYETEEKENQIALLNEQAKLEQANLKQAMLVRNVTIAGIIAALIIAALLFRQNRLKQKNNNVITQKNQLLQHYLTEKEWLLKEIHHRVKNNLQIIMSLLNSQSVYIDNETARTAIHDSQHRVQAMSLIHQKLYNTENVSSINMPNYIRELVSYLGESFNARQRIRFELNLEPIDLDVSQAVPLGLIINEAVTNSIKYAFPGNGNGIIAVSLTTAGQACVLTVADNGTGMPEHAARPAASLGMSLMEGLSRDLDGQFRIENNNGTTIKVLFENQRKRLGDIPWSAS